MIKRRTDARLYGYDLWSDPDPADTNSLSKREKARHAARNLLKHYPPTEADGHLLEALTAVETRNQYAGLEKSGRAADLAAVRSKRNQWGREVNAQVAAYHGMSLPIEGGPSHELASALVQFDRDFGSTGEQAHLVRRYAAQMILERRGITAA